MYAVVATGGKQYRVEPGTELIVERLPGDAGSSVTFERVLLVGDGESVTVGTPTVDGATVSGTVIGDANGPKLVIFKFKQKVKYRRRTGHRQHLTRVRIDEISASGKTARAEKAATPQKPAKAEAPAKAASATTTAEAAAAEPAPEKPKRTRKAPAAADTAEKPKRSRTTAAKAASAPKEEADETAKPKRTRKAPAKAAEE